MLDYSFQDTDTADGVISKLATKQNGYLSFYLRTKGLWVLGCYSK